MNINRETDSDKVAEIGRLASLASVDNIGDVLSAALYLSFQIEDSELFHEAENFLSRIRGLARNPEIGWRISATPPQPNRSLGDDDYIQLLGIVNALQELCYCAERLDEASFLTWESSIPVRFYINSMYHYISALYLLDKGKFAMGGSVFKTLDSMGLAHLLEPIQSVLDEPMGGGISFGETVRAIRNKFFVHGSFNPSNIESVVKQTQMREVRQKYRLVMLSWILFNVSLVLKLMLIALLTASDFDLHKLIVRLAYKERRPTD